MPAGLCLGWDYAAVRWRKVGVNASGDWLIAPGAAITFDTHCYGYDGANWQELPVESAGNPNLRTRLYAGANAVAADQWQLWNKTDANYGLAVNSLLHVHEAIAGTVHPVKCAKEVADAASGDTIVPQAVYGYNGASFDRLRMESGAAHNLRTRLYGGANAVAVEATGHVFNAEHGLFALAQMYAEDPAGGVKPCVADSCHRDEESVWRHALITQTRLYGYNGTTWDRFRMESATSHNLRVKLYDGANGIDANTLGTWSLADAKRALNVNACLRVSNAGSNVWKEVMCVNQLADTRAGMYMLPVCNWGYNGASWDRLRSYPTGILKTCRAEGGLTDTRATATGQVASGSHRLYWLTVNPSAAEWNIELTDATDDLAAIKWDTGSAADESKHYVFDPPLEFATGIWVESLTNITSAIFGYM